MRLAARLARGKPSGEPWDFLQPSDQKLAVWLDRIRKTDCVIGAPPCTAFSRRQGLNPNKVSKNLVATIIQEGLLHLHAMPTIYSEQLKGGRHVLHEHPATAASWQNPRMQQLLQYARVQTTVCEQCEYRLTTADGAGNQALAKRPTRFAPSSTPRL